MKSVLVIGGGISGIQAALDLAEMGVKVHLVEESPSIGGHMAQLDKTFPTNDCAMCILGPKVVEVARHPNIQILTYAEVEEVSSHAEVFKVKVKKKARFVDLEKCTGCGDCTKECPVEVNNEFNLGLDLRKAIYRPFPQAVPNTFVIDKMGTPPCRDACPAGVNVQGYIALIRQGKFREALELVRRDIPFPAVCGRVCFNPCENECERSKVDEPLSIRSLKRFVADYELNGREEREKPAPIQKTHREKVAIIGSGPAGLTAAYDLVKMGYSVVVFESLPEPGGMLRYGIPEYRLPKEALDADIRYMKDLGVDIKTNTRIGKDLTVNKLSQEYKAVFIAVGAQISRKLGIKGEELNGVVHALDFLRDVNLGKKVKPGDRIAVIGGGNVAIDAARTGLRLGSEEVHLLYRRSRKEMPAHLGEVEQAEREGVIFHFLASPTRIIGKDGKVVGIESIQMKLGTPDESGRRRPVPIEGSEFIIELDAIIPAIGQSSDISLLPKEIEVTKQNIIAADRVTMETSLPGIFAGGDVVSGPATVIEAIAAGKRVAVSIDRFLRGEDLMAGREEEVKVVEEVLKEGIETKERQVMPLLPLDQRIGNFKEIELGFTEEMAVEEAGRCLSCGGCSECLECEKLCEAKAIIHDQKDEHIELDVGAIIVAIGYDLYDPSPLKEYGYGIYKDVITGLELERLISASGPTVGKLLRPSDGKEPHTIGFIQCVGSRDEKVNPYCCSVCCMFATKESILLKEHDPKADVYIFYTDLRTSGKGSQEYIDRAKEEYKVNYIRSRPGEIIKDPENNNLKILYHLGREVKSKEVDLVILATTLVPNRGAKRLSDILGINLDEHGFFEVKDQLRSPVDTNVPGIFVCGFCECPTNISESVLQASGAAERAMEWVEAS